MRRLFPPEQAPISFARQSAASRAARAARSPACDRGILAQVAESDASAADAHAVEIERPTAPSQERREQARRVAVHAVRSRPLLQGLERDRARVPEVVMEAALDR